jgi:hypothetical protein
MQISHLQDETDKEAFEAAWSNIFLQESLTTAFLRDADATAVMATIGSGQKWTGAGWDTTRCALAVRKLTGVAMVESTLQPYLAAYLYSLALTKNVSIPSLELSDKASDVAFKLYEKWTTATTTTTTTEMDRDEEAGDEEAANGRGGTARGPGEDMDTGTVGGLAVGSRKFAGTDTHLENPEAQSGGKKPPSKR